VLGTSRPFRTPTYHRNEIEDPILIKSGALPDVPRRVYIHGQVAFLKSVGARDVNNTNRELKAYIKMQ
jgi:hypothetical protein